MVDRRDALDRAEEALIERKLKGYVGPREYARDKAAIERVREIIATLPSVRRVK